MADKIGVDAEHIRTTIRGLAEAAEQTAQVPKVEAQGGVTTDASERYANAFTQFAEQLEGDRAAARAYLSSALAAIRGAVSDRVSMDESLASSLYAAEEAIYDGPRGGSEAEASDAEQGSAAAGGVAVANAAGGKIAQ